MGKSITTLMMAWIALQTAVAVAGDVDKSPFDLGPPCLEPTLQSLLAPQHGKLTQYLDVRPAGAALEAHMKEWAQLMAKKPKTVADLRNLAQRLPQLRSDIVKNMSTESLAHHVEDMIRACKKNGRDYLPGCSPTWTPKDVEQIVQDYVSQPYHKTMLGNVVGNLKTVDMSHLEIVEDILDTLPPETKLGAGTATLLEHFRIWKDQAVPVSIYEEFASRIQGVRKIAPRIDVIED